MRSMRVGVAAARWREARMSPIISAATRERNHIRCGLGLSRRLLRDYDAEPLKQ